MDEKMNTDKGRTAAGVKGNLNVGHGHVIPRPDGVRARCGGPAICPECALDLGRRPAPSPHASACARCANGRLLGKCPDCGKECMQDWQPASAGATPKSMHIAEAIVSELQGRSGFDATWDSLDDDIRQEVLDAISEILVANVAGINQPSPPAPAGEVKFYDTYIGHDEKHGAHVIHKECDSGDWVHASDYDALRTQRAADVAALRDQLQASRCAEKMSSDITKDQAKEIARLREGLAKLSIRPNWHHNCDDYSRGYGQAQADAATIASAALQGEKT